MTTPCKLPFSVALGKREAMRPFTRFTTHPEELKDAPPAWRFTENQDLYLRFEAPMDFRFTMDGLDIVTIPGEERYDGETWVRPRRAWDTLLFKGEDFPLVPGYYVLTVTGRGETWYSLLEITPRYMGKQSWQDMGEELLEEIKHLSFDFMKKSIHMSRALDINPDLLLRFYTISDKSRMVLHVLGELARTANGRLVRRKKPARTAGVSPAASHIPPQSLRPSAGQHLLYTEMTYDVAENRFAKAILLRLAKNLRDFVSEVDGFIARLDARCQALLPYTQNQEYRRGEAALVKFRDYRKQALAILRDIERVTRAAWFEEAGSRMPPLIPMTVLCDPRYSLLYHLHRHLEKPEESYSVADFYQFQWKRTDKLYELWGFLQFIKALSSLGWEMEEGMSVIKEDGRYRLSSLESGTVITMKKGEEAIRLTYDGIVPAASADTDRMTAPLYTNNAHRQPDLRMDCYQGHMYCGCLVVDFKYRDMLFLWNDENRGEGLRRQFNGYRDMNTKFYRDMDETQSLRDSRPVKEVWAVFPREVPGSSDEDYSLRFIPLSPGSESRLPQLLEDYLKSLGLGGD